MDQELVEYLGRRFDQLTGELRQDFRFELATSAAETRRHFDVVAEGLMSKIGLVAEGHACLAFAAERERRVVSIPAA